MDEAWQRRRHSAQKIRRQAADGPSRLVHRSAAYGASALPASTGPTGKRRARKRACSVWSGGKAAKPYLSLPKYANRTLDRWLAEQQVGYRIEVVERPVGAQGFVLLHRRWVVERTLAWLGRYRRNSKDYERLTASSDATVKVRMIHLMLRRLRPDKTKQIPACTSSRKARKAA